MVRVFVLFTFWILTPFSSNCQDYGQWVGNQEVQQIVSEAMSRWQNLSFDEKKAKLDIWLEENPGAKAQWKRNQRRWQNLSHDEKVQRVENFLNHNQNRT